MHLLYGLTVASVAYALALTVPMFLPPLDASVAGALDARTTAHAAPAPLCGNIFDGSGSLCAPRQPAPENARGPNEQLATCDALTLLGVVRDGDAADRALFAEQDVIQRGDDVGSGYTLIEVYADRTVLARGELRCEVSLFDANHTDETVPRAAPAALAATTIAATEPEGFPRRDGRIQVPRAVLDSAPTFLAGVSAVPSPNGLRLRGVAPSSLPSRLGLRSGDLITQVDGSPLTPDTALALVARLGEVERISAQVRRGRGVFMLHADVVD